MLTNIVKTNMTKAKLVTTLNLLNLSNSISTMIGIAAKADKAANK